VTQVADDLLLINPQWVDPAVFADYRLIEIDPDEPHAANVLCIGRGAGAAVLHPQGFERTQQRLADAGLAVATLDVSELQKAEGALTCCSLLIAGPA
jgi:dimethylargininase